MSESFIVIGSNSFSGSQFIKYLLKQNHSVIGVSRSHETNDVFLSYKVFSNESNFKFYKIDINHDIDDFMSICKSNKPNYIVNFAAQGMVAQSWENPTDWYQTNVVAQVKLHDAIRKLPYLKKYVHVTTPEVYGSTDGWISENFNFAPSTPYAVSRAACDMHLMSFFKAYQFPVVFTRAANVYGPGQQLYRIIPKTMLYARLGKKIQLHGGGNSVRSFIHIDDVSDATLRIALHGSVGMSYHISTRDKLTIRELVEQICILTDVGMNSLALVTNDRLGKDQAYLLDSSKLRIELGWEESISLQEGLKEALAWIDTNLEVLKKLPSEYIHKP